MLLVLVALEVEVEPGLVLVHELKHEVEDEADGGSTFPYIAPGHEPSPGPRGAG